MTHKRLVERLEIWERILNLVKILRPGRLYKFNQWGRWCIVFPRTYSLSGMSFHVVVGSQTYLGMKKPPQQAKYTYAYMLKNFEIEEVDKADLPLYLNEPFIGNAMDKILKGKIKIRRRHAHTPNRKGKG